jgi:hypothetical protein
MPIYASSDESTEDGSFMSSDQQRQVKNALNQITTI